MSDALLVTTLKALQCKLQSEIMVVVKGEEICIDCKVGFVEDDSISRQSWSQ